MSIDAGPGHGLTPRLREELRTYAIVSAYLYVCFAALVLYRTALLEDAGLHYAPLGVAALKALVIGKFVLIGDALRKAVQPESTRLLVRIVTRVLWLLAILVLLTLAEELLLGAWHGESMAEVRAAFRGRSTLEMVAELMLMGLILLPLVALQELDLAMGPGTLAGLLTGSRRAAGESGIQGGTGDRQP